jgi:hypothetical protein
MGMGGYRLGWLPGRSALGMRTLFSRGYWEAGWLMWSWLFGLPYDELLKFMIKAPVCY